MFQLRVSFIGVDCATLFMLGSEDERDEFFRTLCSHKRRGDVYYGTATMMDMRQVRMIEKL